MSIMRWGRNLKFIFDFVFNFNHGTMTIVMKENPKKIGAGEFKAKCLGLLDQVYKSHKIYVITKHGKPVAQLVPVLEAEISDRERLLHSVVFEDDIVSPLHVSWEAKL